MSNLHNNPHLELPPPGSPQYERIQYQRLPQQQQQDHFVPSMYPKIPSQDEPPSYSMPQPSSSSLQQHPQGPPPQYQPYPVYQQQPAQQQQQPIQQQPVQQQPLRIPHSPFYGSIQPPSVSSPAPVPDQNYVIQPLETLKTSSKLVQCPHCRQLVYTVLDYDAGVCTALSMGGLFLAGCNNGLCFLPALFPWSKDVTHECPSCKKKIAKFTRLERDTRVLAPPPGL
ncbi:unnamed protein product [Mucor hiemalis]